MVNAARLTNAVSIAARYIERRMLLSCFLVGRQLDLFRVCVRHEREIGIGESRVHLPRQACAEGRSSRISAIDDHQLERKGLVALLDPDFPIHVCLPEGIVVGWNTIERRDTNLIGGLELLKARGALPLAPPEEVLERQRDPELLVNGVERFAVGRRCRSARIESELGRIDGEGFPVVDKAPALPVTVVVDYE